MLGIVATIMSIIAVVLFQDKGVITQNTAKKLLSIAVFIASAVLLCIAYGTMRGIFVFAGLISLVGTLFTLLRYKMKN